MLRHIKRVVDTWSTVLVIVAAVALLWSLYQRPALLGRGSRPIVEDVTGLSIPASNVTHVRGSGRVVLVEFADYECPFCARHAQTTASAIDKELIDSGEIQHVFFNFPLSIHPRAQKAGEAAECAAQQGRFWEMHQQLFQDPKALEISDLSARAESLALDRAKFMKCLEDGDTAEMVRADLVEGRRLGVTSTPAFFVGIRQPNGAITLVKRIYGAVPFETFSEAIRAMPIQRAER